jgi:phenylalanyl-tRNA synthetase beta chain
LIWDAENPVAVAGVMGGADTEVTDKTKNIFLESAYFAPVSVRRTSKKLGLVSESSYRFERGTDIEFLERALNRAALMMQEIAGGTIHEIIDQYPVRYVPEPVEARSERINKLLGTSLTHSEMCEILKRLSIPVEERGDVFFVYPPAHRRDITRESDVAEEIARIYGYDSIPTTIPRSSLSSGRLNKRTMNLNRIRETMRKTGFTEVINYSFMGVSSLDIIEIPESDRRRKTISISNPLGQDECLLRTTLTPALIGNLKYNLDRGMKDIRIFETAKVFTDTGASLPSEELKLGGILYKEKSPSLWREDARGFFLAKGTVESLFEELKIRGYSFSQSSEPFFHAGQASDMYVSASRIGYLGVLGPHVVEKLDLKKQKPEIVLFELNLDLLLACVPDSIQYSPVPKYPSVERDIAIVLDETIPSSRIREVIGTFPTDLIEEVSVFDHFRGGNIPAGKKSLAFNFVYRSKERTLRDEEVEGLHASLVKYLIEKTGGELRK